MVRRVSEESGNITSEGVSNALQWNKIRDDEFNVLVLQALEVEQTAILYTAYGQLLLDQGRAEQADQQLEKALKMEASLAEKYPRW